MAKQKNLKELKRLMSLAGTFNHLRDQIKENAQKAIDDFHQLSINTQCKPDQKEYLEWLEEVWDWLEGNRIEDSYFEESELK
jgi:hypothetical protein